MMTKMLVVLPTAMMLVAASSGADAASASRVVDRYTVTWATPSVPGASAGVPVGQPNPPTGPFVGNGDVTAIYSGNATYVGAGRGRRSMLDWQQWLYLSKNDMWGSDQQDYYPHLSAGRVGINIAPPTSDAELASGNTGVPASTGLNSSVTMFPGNASIVYTLTDVAGSATVAATTRVLENNAVVTTLVCTSKSGATCPVELLLSDTNKNHYKVAQDAGASPGSDLIWWRKENLHEALNPAYVGSCDPHMPLQSVERRFTVGAGGTLQMVNGSCLWADESSNASGVTSGDCALPQGGWKWEGSASKGDIVQTASSKCLSATLKLGACGSKLWAQIPSGSVNSSEVYLQTVAKTGCLVVVPDNNNNTLGVSLGIADPAGTLVKGRTARVNATDASAGMSLSLSLKPSTEYTLLVGLQTLRDIGCAGIRPQWEKCTKSPEDAAALLVRTMAGTSERAAAVATSDEYWSGFWAASSVDLTSGLSANESAPTYIVERWYYLAQYLLGTVARDSKVTPALNGFVCVEPVPWGDQFTLDYNLEATFWGAGSSNRLEFIHPVMASFTNPGAVASARLRAQNPGTWNRPSQWPGHVGTAVPGAVCDPPCPNLTTTGFKGAEWPSAAMPLGDLRMANSDLQTRFTGGLMSTNLIQYWEYSRNVTTLREKIYPFVKDNAEFYLSYAEKAKDGKTIQFPYSCAQEACACRDAGFFKPPAAFHEPLPNSTLQCTDRQSTGVGHGKGRCPDYNGWMLNHACYGCEPDIATGSKDGYHNAHPDVAFASYSFRNAVRFAKILGIDTGMAAEWQAALDAMPEYPKADFQFIAGEPGDEYNGGAGFLVEAEYGHHEGVLPKGKTTAPLVWPWCNREYPISNFAAMWPTDEIGATQTTDAGLLATAKQTVFALNKYQAKPWANTNGFCLSWPPAVRVSGREDAELLVTSFAQAIDKATDPKPSTSLQQLLLMDNPGLSCRVLTSGPNGCVHNKGGMLENIGATAAINDLLLQSHGGRMRFFPAWNATILGAASFTTLRAYGAFLVSATVDATGTVGPVSIESELGGEVVFETAWPGHAPKVVSGGTTIPTTVPPGAPPGVYSFESKASGKYTISGN